MSFRHGISLSFRRSARFPLCLRSHSTVTSASSASPDELHHFAKLADSWWDMDGPQRILHKMNLLRLDYIQDTLKKDPDFSGSKSMPGYDESLLPKMHRIVNESSKKKLVKVLDVGCGGGIFSESMARLDITDKVLGIDMSPDVLEIAKKHRQRDPKLIDKLDYKLAELSGIDKTYDILTLFEVLEHVSRPADMLKVALNKINPGGWIFLSTINRTAVSYVTTIFMGEQVLKIVPPGTHTLSKYINEYELRNWIAKQPSIEYVKSDGCMYFLRLDGY